MGIEDGIIKYEIGIGVKRAGAAFVGAVLGWVGSPAFAVAVTWLAGIGVTVAIDHAKFDPWLVGIVSTGMVFVHDWAKVQFPSVKWL